MKDQLFELLLNLFMQTLGQVRAQLYQRTEANTSLPLENDEQIRLELDFVKVARADSIRVFTPNERAKLSKSSYQFLLQLQESGMIHSGTLELVINRLLFSESRKVYLDETKWIIRKTLMDTLNREQLAFLELVLYQQEQGVLLN